MILLYFLEIIFYSSIWIRGERFKKEKLSIIFERNQVDSLKSFLSPGKVSKRSYASLLIKYNRGKRRCSLLGGSLYVRVRLLRFAELHGRVGEEKQESALRHGQLEACARCSLIIEQPRSTFCSFPIRLPACPTLEHVFDRRGFETIGLG